MKYLHIIMRTLIFLFATSIVASSLTTASENNLAQLKVIEMAEEFVTAQLEITKNQNSELTVKAMPLDPRIKIPDCPVPYEITTKNSILGMTNVTVKASCPTKDWFLYFVIRVKEMQPVVVATSSFSPGTILTKDNTQLEMRDKKLLRVSTFEDKESVLGARIKRRIRPGQPIQPNQLCFVCKGDSITITASSSALTLKTSGIAQQDGNIGDTIRVRNNSSKKVITALVTDLKKVSVNI